MSASCQIFAAASGPNIFAKIHSELDRFSSNGKSHTEMNI